MIIGIIGKKRHGKDTIADYLVDKYAFEKYSFATPLKKGCMEIFGLTENQVFGDEKDKWNEEWNCYNRDLLKVTGTELYQYDIQKYIPSFKEIGRNIWVKRFGQYYKNNNEKNIVIADVRFIHEADKIKELGGYVWKVFRPQVMDENDTHASELEQDQILFDEYLENDSNLDELYKKIELSFKR